MDYNVTVRGVCRRYPEGTDYEAVAKDFCDEYEGRIILADVGGKLTELGKKIKKDCNVDFITIRDRNGRLTYTRGLILLMLKAIYKVADKTKFNNVKVEFSIGAALYCEFDGELKPDKELIDKIKQEMTEISKADLDIKKSLISTDDAVELFNRVGMYDKEKLFRYRRVSKTNIYNLDGFIDYYYGYMPPRTGYVDVFDLVPYEDGFFIVLPDEKNPSKPAAFSIRRKLYLTQKEADEWGKKLDTQTVGDLNEHIAQGEISDLILVQEAFQEKKIAEIAEQIKEAGNKKFIMIAGPSSSGKTTFSHRLSIQLRTLGFKPHPIAVDDYFVEREKTPRDADGNYNFEVLEAIDIEKFNEDMKALLNGEVVELPTFNFKTGKREYKGNFKKLGPDDILVIEGIHGLNDKLSYSLPRESKFKIYISALTSLNIDEHNRIPTTDARLLRRMVRDARTRGSSAKRTIQMWPSVRRGEEENIFPFQEDCDCMFNSALIYELAVLKQFAEPLLFQIQKDEPEYKEAKRLLKFLEYFLGVSTEELPKNSIIREFVGGSCFKV